MACSLGVGTPSTPNNTDDLGLAENSLSTTTVKGSNIKTLIPYDPFNKRQKFKKQSQTKDHVRSFNALYGPQTWTKYFEVQSKFQDDFDLYKDLASKTSHNVTFRYMSDGTRIVEAHDAHQSQLLQDLVAKEDPNIAVKTSKRLNICQGTVLVPNDMQIGDDNFEECAEKIKENIEIQGFKVQTVKTFIRPSRGKRKYELRVASITFEGRVLPETIVVGGQRLTVKEYILHPTMWKVLEIWTWLKTL